MRLPRMFTPRTVASAHCDLPCGIYDPAQARIEAESVKAISEKYQANQDPEFRTRALIIKEQRSELVKHHLWVLWTDYFKPPHFEKYPQLHSLFNEATKLAARPARRVRPTRPRPRSCWARSRRSPRSSGRPSRPERRGGPAGASMLRCSGRFAASGCRKHHTKKLHLGHAPRATKAVESPIGGMTR